jgi:hypothetical protein
MLGCDALKPPRRNKQHATWTMALPAVMRRNRSTHSVTCDDVDEVSNATQAANKLKRHHTNTYIVHKTN